MKVKTFSYALLAGSLAGLPALGQAEWQALPEQAPAPADNPASPAKVELGKTLYFDPRLSSTGTVSCNSCHNVMLGGDDNRDVSMGVHGNTGGRSAPTVWNAAFNASQFWDGRAADLEEQAKGPVTNPVEMGMKDLNTAIEAIRAIPGYEAMFTAAFGSDAVNEDNMARAIAAYERTLITPNSPYDHYVKGERDAMSEQQVRGMEAFKQAGCVSCHAGPAFNGADLASDGGGLFMKFPLFTDNPYVERYDFMADQGRAEATGKAADAHMWKVPTLRNVALTAPYFHNGAVKTLDEAVRVMAKTQLNQELSEQQVEDIVAFLGALTGKFPEQSLPRLPGTPGFTVIK